MFSYTVQYIDVMNKYQDLEILSDSYIQILFSCGELLKFYIPKFYTEKMYKLIYGNSAININGFVAAVKNIDNTHNICSTNDKHFKGSLLYYNKILFKTEEAYIGRCNFKNFNPPNNITAKDIKIFNYEIAAIITACGYIRGPLHII